MKAKGNIDKLSDNLVLHGWVVCDPESKITICDADDELTTVNELLPRQDVIDAGLTDTNSGFKIDLNDILKEKEGSLEFNLNVDGNTVANFTAYIPSKNNLIENCFLDLADPHSINNWDLKVNHRTGLQLSRFLAPSGLKHSDGFYTRLKFGDINNTRHILSLIPKILPSEAKTLKLAIVAKASHESHLHIVLTNSDGKRVYNEPLSLYQNWTHNVIELNEELTSDLISNNLTLSLTTKHHGRRFIDIAMVQLSEALIEPKERFQNTVEPELYTGSIIKNGDLSYWPNGVIFNNLRRGQELAENWFIEMSKANLGKLDVAVVTDNNQNDPLASVLKSKFALRVRSKKLDGYARLVVPFNKQSIEGLSYQLELDIEASGLKNKVTLPRIYLIARDARNDEIVLDIIRKKVIHNRETIRYNLDSRMIENLLERAKNYPVITLAIDVDHDSDITIFNASLHLNTNQNTVNEEQSESVIETSNDSFIAFEDSSITEQLSVLKGLELWSTETTVLADSLIEEEKNTESNALTLNHDNEFLAHIAALSPHKMKRPSRQFPFIDVIVPVYNACDDVLLCLSALIEKTDLLHRVIVINDGQDERTATMLSAFNDSFSHLEVVTNPENIGYTKSVNKGIKHANADWVVVLNSDTIVSEGWLGKLMNCAQSTDNVGMVGALSNAASWQSVPCIHDKNGDWHLNPLPENMTIDQMADKVAAFSERAYPEVGVINGFCQLINMEMLDKIGLLDEVAFPVGYGEENDMCARAVKGGFKLLIADDTYVFHAKSKSFGHSKRKELAKQGSLALKKKHPDVDWGQVTKKIYEHPSLVTLREQLATALSE